PAPSAPAPSTPAAAATATVGEVSWRWPAGGVLVGSFVAGDPTRQGIDLAGKAGDPVRAAAAGSVVYSGNGLVGYGELIIIKHNASFLSAYGHNRKRMVREGEQVQAGQVIAEMGSSSASRDSLHFEIRRNGKPVNPLDYLPRR
ncbi:MAG: peptidoglycan DD-metalloendopeptidase family protein, partial [Dokdonella sp.]|nr:peptidoglycan DD-metalloendopeptidase family protein [Dokdonella sp.]